MRRFTGKILLIAFAALLFQSYSTELNAWPIDIEIKIKYGHHETINGKIFCVDFGICEYEIIISIPLGARSSSGDFVSFPAEAEVKDGTLYIKFAKKLDRKYMYPEDTYTFPVEKDIHIEGKDAEALGLKKFTIRKGQYKFDGQQLKIRLSNVKANDKKKDADGTE